MTADDKAELIRRWFAAGCPPTVMMMALSGAERARRHRLRQHPHVDRIVLPVETANEKLAEVLIATGRITEEAARDRAQLIGAVEIVIADFIFSATRYGCDPLGRGNAASPNREASMIARKSTEIITQTARATPAEIAAGVKVPTELRQALLLRRAYRKQKAEAREKLNEAIRRRHSKGVEQPSDEELAALQAEVERLDELLIDNGRRAAAARPAYAQAVAEQLVPEKRRFAMAALPLIEQLHSLIQQVNACQAEIERAADGIGMREPLILHPNDLEAALRRAAGLS